MHQLIEKLTGRKQILDITLSSNSPIFGSSTNLARALEAATVLPKLRIGLWPIRSKDKPEIAMGIGMILSLLLSRWRSIQIYRLLAQVSGEPNEYEWTIEQSQFGVDDWEIEGLNENVAIWGNLEHSADGYTLVIEVENDLSGIDETKTLSYSARTLSGIIAQLPDTTKSLAEYLDAGSPSPLLPDFEAEEWDADVLEALLKQIFNWERNLWLWMWGKTWLSEHILKEQELLVNAGQSQKCDLASWAIANSIARVFSSVFAPINDTLIPLAEEIATTFNDYPHAAVALSLALFRFGDPLRAYDLLETTLEAHPNDLVSWFTLAELYRQGNEVSQAMETFQRAIKGEIVSSSLYMRYADLLLLLDANNVMLNIGAHRTSISGRKFNEEVVLVGDEEYTPQLLIAEAVEAFRAALAIEPHNMEALLQLTLHLIELGSIDEIWDSFKQLVDLDQDGESVRAIVEVFYILDDIEPGISILQNAVSKNTERLSLQLSLAIAYLNDEQYEAAKSELNKARSLTTNPVILAEIERLLLPANDPEFEAQFGNITDLINAGAEVSAQDIEFLEDILDKAPLLAQAYILLAAAYQKWDEPEDALDVLLDGQKLLPQDAEIISALAEVLWESGEAELALDYLNKGLAANPTHAGLLALTGKYLFDDGQQDAAREFLQRAESLDSRHPLLIQARVYIARKVADQQ
ncbi:MAG: hypothetical protein K8L97_21245 [Anaerolineae bacterium]|nr:hypothetical protein [Anaerolineae bacterium]